ncbi:LysR substrate-binding domain-containing protein [Rhizobium sp. BE258]|uniref:LysR substrate-binding domain-containing protein n=1 Tax=Rhizobium sp. BE258 TaxID=2817722 RepID=UPI00386CFA89
MGCPTPFVDLVVTRTVPNFLKRYPDVSVQVVGTEHNSDLVGEGIDVGIRSSRTHETQSSIVMRRLGKTSSVLVASPDFLQRAGPIASISELEQAPLLTATSFNDEEHLQMSGPNNEVAIVRKRARLACRSIPAFMAALRSGRGVAMLPRSPAVTILRPGGLSGSFPIGARRTPLSNPQGNSPAGRVLIDFFVQNTE